jgi:hypothetical protein
VKLAEIIYSLSGVLDPHHFDANSDPSFHIDADPEPTFHIDADADPTFNIDADPDTVSHQSYANLRLLVNRLHCERLRPSIAPF